MKPRALPFGLLALLTVGGLYAAVQQLRHGDAVTGLGAGGVVWGLSVVGDGFFASVGLACLMLAAILRLSRTASLAAAAHNAVSLAAACLVASMLCVLADLGRAWVAAINLSLLGRARAPFFATFTLVAGASLCAALVQWFLTSRVAWAERARDHGMWRILARGPQGSASAAYRRGQVDFWYGLGLLPLLLLALVILARVFCVRPGRPVLLIHLETITFVISAGAAACGLVLLVSPRATRVTLARILSVLVALSVVFIELCQMVALRSPGAAVQGYVQALLHGPWRVLFWVDVALFLGAGVLVLARLWKGQASLVWMAGAACLIGVAVFIQRYLLVVAWQTHGLGLSWPTGHYRPTGVEVGLLLGIAALAAAMAWLLMTLGPYRGVAAGCPSPRQARRTLVTAACLLVGGASAVFGLALAAGVGSWPFLDPVVPGGPLIFLGGLLLILLTPVVYELLPES